MEFNHALTVVKPTLSCWFCHQVFADIHLTVVRPELLRYCYRLVYVVNPWNNFLVSRKSCIKITLSTILIFFNHNLSRNTGFRNPDVYLFNCYQTSIIMSLVLIGIRRLCTSSHWLGHHHRFVNQCHGGELQKDSDIYQGFPVQYRHRLWQCASWHRALQFRGQD